MIFRRSLLTKILDRQIPSRAALFVVLSILFAKAALAQESVVRFEPAQTKVTFSVPGNYRIRAIASDGALFSTSDVDVKVNPSSSP